MKLNLGCGAQKLAGYTNVDWNSAVAPDVVWNLSSFPYPFKDGSCDEILASHILEHLQDPFVALREFHRLLRPGGELLIKVPHFSRGFTHPEHKSGFDISLPKYLDPSFTASGYIGVHFQLIEMKLTWFAFPHLAQYYGISPGKLWLINCVNSILSLVANLSPMACSKIWCFWVGGFDEIAYQLRCVKNG